MVNYLKRHSRYLFPLLIVIATFFCYYKVLHAGINNWDDAAYVFKNKDITSFSVTNIKQWFSNFYVGNYHPLTMASYALDWFWGGADPFYYHLTNILLHLANSLLVYTLVNFIFRNYYVAFFVALIFAIHPVQTESVSWIAERKNVLYGFFYLSSIFCYVLSIQLQKRSWFIAAIMLGIASMLSKAAALSLPFSFIAIDLFLQRAVNKKEVWLEKIPLFIVAAILGSVGILAQKSGGFLNLHPDYGLFEKIGFAGYAYASYILTLLFPVNLSVWYPYPVSLSGIHFLGLIFSIFIIALAFFSYRRKWYVLSGGILFFSCNIFLVLQFVQFGESLRADRYLYIPCLGLLIPMIYYLVYWAKTISKKIIVFIAMIMISGILMFSTFLRNDIWLSEHNFWEAILKEFPNSAVAKYSMGALYLNEGDYINATPYVEDAVKIDPGNYKAWYNKGVLDLRQNKFPSAITALSKCLAIDKYPKAFFTRALAYQQIGKCSEALNDINIVLQDEPENARAYFIKADCLEQQNNLAAAINNYNSAVQFESNEPMFYMRRALVFAKIKQFSSALNDLNVAIQLRPDAGAYWYWRGMVKYNAGQNPCDDLQQALNRNFKQAEQALTQICGR